MKINVLQLISSTGMFGAENVVLELIKEIDKERINPFLGIIENNSKAHFMIAEEGKKYTQNIKTFRCNGRFDTQTILSLKRFIRENKIDIIHSHGYKANFYSYITAASKRIPIISTCHNWISANTKMRFYEWMDKKLLQKFDRIIVVSDEVMKKNLESGVALSRLLKIRNGITLDKYSGQSGRIRIRNEFGINNDCIVIGSVGRLDRNKGIRYLLHAVKPLIQECNRIYVLITGEGPSRQEINEEAKTLGIGERIKFSGFRSDIPSILSAIDIFVLPSLNEGLPMVILEAMAAGKPVVASRVGDIPKVIDNNESGILVDPGDPGQLREALKKILSNNSVFKLLGDKAFEKIQLMYTSLHMANQYMKVYEDVLRERLN